jgi:hypothetical protein
MQPLLHALRARRHTGHVQFSTTDSSRIIFTKLHHRRFLSTFTKKKIISLHSKLADRMVFVTKQPGDGDVQTSVSATRGVVTYPRGSRSEKNVSFGSTMPARVACTIELFSRDEELFMGDLACMLVLIAFDFKSNSEERLLLCDAVS